MTKGYQKCHKQKLKKKVVFLQNLHISCENRIFKSSLFSLTKSFYFFFQYSNIFFKTIGQNNVECIHWFCNSCHRVFKNKETKLTSSNIKKICCFRTLPTKSIQRVCIQVFRTKKCSEFFILVY